LIEVLLATHNSGVYVNKMLASIKQQSYENLSLLIYDDASQDESSQIIRDFEPKNDIKVQSFINDKRPLGPVGAFNFLLQKSNAEYVAFADHDDVWFPNKIEKSMRRMLEAEKKYGKEIPIMVYSDMCVVDKNLNIINDSFFEYQNINPRNCSLNRLLLQNVPSGCTIVANRALADLVGKIPEHAVMHDHWISLVAAAFGKIIYLNEPTLHYRQHENNFYGASPYGWRYFYKKYRTGVDNIKERLYQNITHGKAFLDSYREILSPEQIEMLEAFSKLREKSWLEKRRILIKYKIFKSGWCRNLGTLLII
jgi:glycosyltransferase involved in cell wall biosynthesis